MRSTEDSLFRLVQSMTLKERSQFKKCQKDKDAGFVRLFDFIQKMPEYDSNALKTAAKNKLGIKNFSESKNYLYNSLIEFLIDYTKTISIAGKIGALSDRAKILFYKGLFDEAKAIIEEAKKMAEHYETFLTLLELIDMELQLTKRLSKRDIQPHDSLFRYREQISRKKEMIDQYQKIYARMLVFYELSKSSEATPEMLSDVQAIKESSLMKNYPENEPFYCKFVYLSVQNLYQKINRIKPDGIGHLTKWIDLWMGQIQMKERLKVLFFNSITAYMEEGVKMKYFIRFPELIPHADGVYNEFKDLEGLGRPTDISNYILIKSWVALHQGKLASAIKLLEEAVNTVDIKNIPAFNLEWYSIARVRAAILFLLENEFKTANKHLNWIINNCTEKNGDIIFKAKIFRMMVADNAQEYFFLGELVNTTEKYFIRINRQFAIETVFINYFRKVSKSDNANERIVHLNELRNNLSTGFEARHLEDYFLFNPFIWIDSKLNEKPAIDIFKEKALNSYPEIFAIQL